MLLQGCRQLGIKLTDQQVESLETYLELLVKWNRHFNLSGITDPLQMVGYHLLDSLAIAPYLRGGTVLDLGSGAGLPGIPLAVYTPDKRFYLLDSNGKKTRFLFQVKLALDLGNVSVANSRVEDYECPDQIDIVTSRAFAPLATMVKVASRVTGGSGMLLAMKGTYPAAEIDGLPDGYSVTRATPLDVPGVAGERYLIEIPLRTAAR